MICKAIVPWWSTLLLAQAVWAWSGTARADSSTKQCIAANARAQLLRKAGKFSDAREQLTLCTPASCPGMVRDDCSQQLDALERAQPTIVFQVQDGDGRDMTVVRVSVDGHPWLDRVGGTAVAADPGPHTFRFEVAGLPAVTRTFVLTEGEKARRERVIIGATTPAFKDAPPSPTAPDEAPPPAFPAQDNLSAGAAKDSSQVPVDPGRAQRLTGLLVGGAGVAGLVVGTVATAIAATDWSDARGACNATNCPGATRADAVSKHDGAQGAATVATIAMIAGGALAATGVVLYLTAPRQSNGAGAWLWVTSTASLGGGTVRLQGVF